MNPLKIGFLAAFAIAFAVAQPAVAEDAATKKIIVDPLLKTGNDIVGQPIAYPPGAPGITAVMITIEPGGTTGWHIHEVPLYAYILDGELTVDYGDKGTNLYKPGEAFMEAMNWVHNGTNNTDKPVRLMAVFMGSDEKANTVPKPAPK